MFALRRLPFFLNWFLLLFGLLWSCLVLGFELYIDDALAFEVDYCIDKVESPCLCLYKQSSVSNQDLEILAGTGIHPI